MSGGAYFDNYYAKPDDDSEFTFGRRSVYVEDSDEVSEFTDYKTVQTADFDPVGAGAAVQRKDPRQPQQQRAPMSSSRQPPPPPPPRQQPQRQQQQQRGMPGRPPSQNSGSMRMSGPVGAGPPPPQRGMSSRPPSQNSANMRMSGASGAAPPPQRGMSSRSSSRNSNLIEPNEELFRDEHEMPVNEHEAPKEKFVKRVTDWYNEVEATGISSEELEEGQRRSLVQYSDKGSSVRSYSDRGSVRSYNQRSQPPPQPYDYQSARHKKMRALLIRLIVACCCLFLVSMAAAIALVFLFTDVLDKNDDSEQEPKNVVLTDPPTVPPTPSPTEASTNTMAPTPDELPIHLIETLNGPFSYGTAVAMDKNFLTVGSPGTSNGLVSALSNDGSMWNFVPELSGTANSAFGAALDVVKPANGDAYVLVGAPEAAINKEGSAALYRHDSQTNSWVAQGIDLEGSPTASTTPEMFGTSVSLSHNLRAVIGAPDHDTQGLGAGRIYTFQYRLVSGEYEALPMVSGEQILGKEAGARFGYDVDITDDGNFIAAGSPGSSEFSIYNWDGNIWLRVFQFLVPSEQDFGTSVNFLSNNYVAVGAPSWSADRGVIRVFKVTNDISEWKELPIITGGSRGDRLGAKDTVSGHEGPFGPELVVGTGSGTLERYDLIGNRWVRRYSVDRDPAVTAVSAYSDNNDHMVFVGYGSGRDAMLYSGKERSAPITAEPTDSPTPAPAPRTWQVRGGPFVTSDVSTDTKFGHDVALVDDYLAIGEPLGRTDDLGDVVIRQRSANWATDEEGFAIGTRKFGYALDAAMVDGKASVLVGAVDTEDGNNNRFGSVHFYQLDNSGTWSAVGGAITPPYIATEAAGMFGASVSMATDVKRIVVGAPSSSTIDHIDCGKVRTYEYNGQIWEEMAAPKIGSGPSMHFGASVAMSKDGSRMVVGSPGDRSGDGTAFMYQWNATASEWKLKLPLRGYDGDGEGQGTTVAFLSDDNKRLAFGGPHYGNEQGIIKVYQESGNSGFFEKLGGSVDIVGDFGDKIGETLCGAKGRLAFGTANGSFRVYEFQSNTWVQIATGPNLGNPVVSISMSDDGDTVALGLQNQEVVVYDLA